ncbi:MAG: hypothetical protein R2795_12370 [Saprospiraceae bacterium]
MKNLFFNHYISKIEGTGNNDLLLIMEFGAEAYTTPELYGILEEVQSQKQLTTLWQHRLFMVGFSISLWIAGAFLCAAFDQPLYSYLFLLLVPTSLLSAILGHYYLRNRYPAFRDVQLIASIIQQELERRKKDASIY